MISGFATSQHISNNDIIFKNEYYLFCALTPFDHLMMSLLLDLLEIAHK